MGRCKQLLPLGDKPFIVRCIEGIIAAGVGDIVVVVGPRGNDAADTVADTIRQFPVTIVRNPDPESDMASSARVGMGAVFTCTGVLVCLADHPMVSPDTYKSLLLHHEAEPEAVFIPVHEGKKGHPTLFPRPLLEELVNFPTLRDIVIAYAERVRLVAVADRGVTVDIDTPEDYRAATRAFI